MQRNIGFKVVTILVLVMLVTIGGGVAPSTPAWAADKEPPVVQPLFDEVSNVGDEGVAAPLILDDQSEKAGSELTLDDRFAEIARQVPAFGGLFYDEGDQLSMYVVESGRDKQSQTMAAVRTVLADDDRLTQAGEIRIVPGQYGFLQLKEWHDRLTLDALGIPGVIFTDINEATNRIHIGVEQAVSEAIDRKQVAPAMVDELLAKLSVPHEAVVIEKAEPIQFAAHTLRSRVRPLEGGLEIRFPVSATSAGICTLGFIATRLGVQGMVTNSHCTRTQGGVEGTVYHQATVAAGNVNRIGLETRDPAYFVGGACPAGRRCRYSDTAFARVPHPSGPSVTVRRGYIARPTGLGAIAINHVVPRFRIVGETSFPIVGERLNKVGRTTGWSRGLVTQTCVNTNVSGSTITLLCQDRVAASVGGGDSGSPVFRVTNSPATSDVRLYGILWGGNTSGTQFVFSAIGSFNVQRVAEMGALTTCAAGFVC